MYKTYRIDEICSLVKGKYATLKTDPGEYPLVVTAPFRRSSNTYQLVGPAVCVPLISSTGHGHAAIDRIHYQEGKFALANLLVALIPKKPNVCSARYLFYLLSAKKDESLVPLMLGTANVSLKMQDIAGVEIPLPPVEEQRRISDKIENLLAKIEEVRKLKAATAKETEALFLCALNEQFNFDEDIEVQKQPIASFATILRGRGPIYEQESGKLAINQKCVRWDRIDISCAKEVSDVWIQSLPSRYLLQENDLVVNSTGEGTIGRVCVVTPNAIGFPFDSHILVVRTERDRALPAFVAYFLRSPIGQSAIEASKGAKTTKQTELGTKKLGRILIPIPSLQEQRSIVTYLDSLRKDIKKLEKLQEETEKEIEELIPSTLDRAFKVEL